MPAITHVVLYDDKDWPETKTEADEVVTVTVTRRPVSGGEQHRRVAELYLSGAHAAELDSGLDPWFAAGHKPAGIPGSRGRPDKENRPGMPPPGTPERRRWKTSLRAWSDDLGLVNRNDPRWRAWQTTTGKHTYPGPLVDGFVLHKEGHEDEARAMVAPFMPKKEEAA